MDWQRSLLIAGMLIVLYMLFLEWDTFQSTQEANQTPVSEETVLAPEMPQAPSDRTPASAENEIPTLQSDTSSVTSTPVESTESETTTDRLLSVSTDVLNVLIDTRGGDIVRVSLPEHLTELEKDSPPFVLLNQTASTTYIAQSGLIGVDGTDNTEGRPLFKAAKNDYQLAGDADELHVDMVFQQNDVTITKRFSFTRGDHLIEVSYLVDNRGTDNWKAGLFGQIKRDSHEPQVATGMGMNPYVGAALRTTEENYKKLDFGDLAEKPFKDSLTGGWVAMIQHYFISAWIPDQSTTNTFSLRQLGNQDLYAIGFTSPQTSVEPGTTGEFKAAFYAGPKDQYRLEKISPYLDLTVDYGWLWWVSKPLFWVLYQLHELIGNWGWSIILLTIFIKAAFYKLSATSYRSMANMRRLQPEMMRLKDLYGDDRQKLSQETMNLYKREKVNPMGGCLPILVQMPVFIALYWVLFESVELRHAPWILWIQDLSVKDPLFILPLLMGASMYVQQKLNPTPPDPTQAKIMQMMPIAFTFFFMFFPAGLVLYWTVNNLLSILQQWMITRQIEAASAKKK
ncbi:membrane protein insertase YidC [uncultured Porticoccus sp.]|uniref:membrane protein insertase YidC n=1 Tax=uncultured Porticoccus sp. TaxID=1256050 RepID=UPI0030DC8777